MVAPQWYAKAFVEAIAKSKNAESPEYARGIELMIDRLIALIKRNGDWPRRTKIIAACEVVVRAATGKRLFEVASAHRLSGGELQMLEKKFPKEVYDYKMTEDRGLIGGVRCTIDESLECDLTLARMMRNMFAQ